MISDTRLDGKWVQVKYKARSSERSWAEVAHRFDYYDQMHMVHDFAEFTGATHRRH